MKTISRIMKGSWALVGMLFFPAMDGRFEVVTGIAIAALNVALLSTIVYYAMYIKNYNR